MVRIFHRTRCEQGKFSQGPCSRGCDDLIIWWRRVGIAFTGDLTIAGGDLFGQSDPIRKSREFQVTDCRRQDIMTIGPFSFDFQPG